MKRFKKIKKKQTKHRLIQYGYKKRLDVFNEIVLKNSLYK